MASKVSCSRLDRLVCDGNLVGKITKMVRRISKLFPYSNNCVCVSNLSVLINSVLGFWGIWKAVDKNDLNQVGLIAQITGTVMLPDEKCLSS
ncbi:unnamed protein product, partial [Porites evermanni]